MVGYDISICAFYGSEDDLPAALATRYSSADRLFVVGCGKEHTIGGSFDLKDRHVLWLYSCQFSAEATRKIFVVFTWHAVE